MNRRVAAVSKLVVAEGISGGGDWALNTAASVYVFRETDSTAAVAGVLALAALPAVILGPLAGAVADRHDRRKVIFGADLASSALLLAVLPLLSTSLDLVVIYAAVLAIGIMATFHRPAAEALLPSLASASQLGRANSALRLAQRVGFIAGPAAGAALIDNGGLSVVVAMDAATFLVCAGIVAAIPRVRQPLSSDSRESPFRAARLGIGYARDRRDLSTVIFSVGVTMLVAPIVNAGTVTFVADELDEPASWYGWLLAAEGVGAIVFASVLLVAGPRIRLLPTGIAALVVTGVSVVVLAISQELLAPFVAMTAMGMGVIGLQIAFSSYLQRETEDSFRGRVMSLVAVVANVGMLVGYALTPLIVAGLGVRTAFGITGAIIMLSAIPVITLVRRGPQGAVVPVALSGREPAP